MIKGISVEMGGRFWEIPPLNLGTLERLQADLASLNGLDAKSVKTMLDAIHAALKRNYPEITREEVAEMVDVANMGEIMEAVMDISGMKRKAKELEAMEGSAAGELSTGAGSTLTS